MLKVKSNVRWLKFQKSISILKFCNALCLKKIVPFCDCPYLCQILSDFKNFFTGTFFRTVSNSVVIKYPTKLQPCCYTTM